ncbi:MAG: MBL fold metallo-hydrolase [Bacteroidota bacterium]
MNRRTFAKIVVTSTLPLMAFTKKTWSVQLIRHATLILNSDDVRILIDPMLSPKGALDPVANAGNDIRIPMVDLPSSVEKILKGIDAVFITHTHRDHWDAEAQKVIDKSMPIFCQPADLEKIKGQGFTNVAAIEDKTVFKGITIHRTGGQHGTGEIGQKMGTVSGYVFDKGNERIYVAGDTIWCNEVEEALKKFKPQTTIVNAGGAQFLTGGPITMNEQDVKKVSGAVSPNTVVAVHMDTVNHCNVTRAVLKKFVLENNLTNIQIPDDGTTLTF